MLSVLLFIGKALHTVWLWGLVMKIYFISIPFFVFLISSCAQEGFYHSQQTILRQECEKLNSPQYEACMSELEEQSYDDYRRERENIMEEDMLNKKLLD